MSTHRLLARQFVPGPIDEVFAFFAEPENLRRLRVVKTMYDPDNLFHRGHNIAPLPSRITRRG